MCVYIANAITTGASLSNRALRLAKAHYENLAALLVRSGPSFQTAYAEAIRQHNRAVQRLIENEDIKARRAEADRRRRAGLVELQP
jgi:ATP phosphoribosyltransferase